MEGRLAVLEFPLSHAPGLRAELSPELLVVHGQLLLLKRVVDRSARPFKYPRLVALAGLTGRAAAVGGARRVLHGPARAVLPGRDYSLFDPPDVPPYLYATDLLYLDERGTRLRTSILRRQTRLHLRSTP